MGRNGQGALVPPAPKVCERVDEIVLPWFWWGHPFIPLVRLSPWRSRLRSTGPASARLIRDFHTVGKLARYSTFPRVIRPFRVSVHSMAMFLSPLGYWHLTLLISMWTSSFQWMRCPPEFSVPMLLGAPPLMQWAVTCVTTSCHPILMKTMATTATSLMCRFILASKSTSVFADTSTPTRTMPFI